MMIWAVKLYIMADAQQSPPPSPPSPNGTHRMGGFQHDYDNEDDYENANDDEYEDYDDDYGDYNYMLSFRVREAILC